MSTDDGAAATAVDENTENADGQPAATAAAAAGAGAGAGRQLSNGFHAGNAGNDLLRDLIAAKFTATANHAPGSKHDKIRLLIEDGISEESKLRVQEIYSRIERLKIEEKLLLYLKFPLLLSNSGSTVDPLRQPLNPLGNRYEIHQTVMWIKTHLEEDPDVSLPKQEVYDEYNMYCIRNSMKPLSTADFGKVMKQVYPRVRPRRLGTRGNSRYCYAGMRKRVKLDPPTLPNISATQTAEDADENVSEEMLGAASTLIREWAESLLGQKFESLSALARHLVENLCVNAKSLAAVCILCSSEESDATNNKESTVNSPLTTGKPAKLREAQLQLQRKLQQREHARDQRHRNVADSVAQNKERTVDDKAVVPKGTKKARSSQQQQPTGTTTSSLTSSGQHASKLGSSAVMTSRQRRVQKLGNRCDGVSPESNCDNLPVSSIQSIRSIEEIRSNLEPDGDARCIANECAFANSQRGKGSRKRANPSTPNHQQTEPSESSPEKQTKHSDVASPCRPGRPGRPGQPLAVTTTAPLPNLSSMQRTGKISVILASNLKPIEAPANENCDTRSSSRLRNDVEANGYSNVDSNFDETEKLPTTTSMTAATTTTTTTTTAATTTTTMTMTMTTMMTTTTTSTPTAALLTRDEIRLLQENANLIKRNEKLRSIETDALDDYLNGGNNSQEQEEELLQYFQQSNSSSSEADAIAVDNTEQVSRSDKVSQLRLILQQNLRAGTVRPDVHGAAVDAASASAAVAITSQRNDTRHAVEKRELTQKHNLILPTLLNHSNQANGNTRRRVSFETNVIEHSQQDSNVVANTVPQSPNTRRRIFNFTPISPGPHSPINGRASKSSSANASPFVSPRNTPVPRSRSNLQGNSARVRSSQKTFSRSISCSVPFTGKSDTTFVVPTSGTDIVRQVSMSRSPLTCTKSSEVQVGISATQQQQQQQQQQHQQQQQQQQRQIQLSLTPKLEAIDRQCTPSFLSSDLTPQKQLLINYPSQENLQEIKNVYQKSQPTDQEISELFRGSRQFASEQLFYRSQSVPLHRMVNPALMSPISSAGQHYQGAFQSRSFDASANSSVAPTPVPSEFNDFVSIGQPDGTSAAYLLDDVDPNFMSSDDQQFLMSDKEIIPENITNILNILDEEGTQTLQILPDQSADEGFIENGAIVLESLPNSNLNLNLSEDDVLDPSGVLDGTSVSGHLQKMIQSRSYPNTPLPISGSGNGSNGGNGRNRNGNSGDDENGGQAYSNAPSSYVGKVEGNGSTGSSSSNGSNGSRSYPSTPLHAVQCRESLYRESCTADTMLSSPTLDSLNHSLHGDGIATDASASNVADLLETAGSCFLDEPDAGDADDLDPLGNFDGLQDVDSLTPLFNEVTETNR